MVLVAAAAHPNRATHALPRLDSLEETLAIMTDRSLTAQIRESEKAAARGEEGVGLDEIRRSLEQRRTSRK